MINKYYSGVGSREIAEDIGEEMFGFGRVLGLKGYILRSGGAEGSDSAFEAGCDSVNGKKRNLLTLEEF